MKMFYSCVTIATHRHLGPWFQEMYVRDTLCTCFKICLRFLIQNIKKKSKTSLQTSRWQLLLLFYNFVKVKTTLMLFWQAYGFLLYVRKEAEFLTQFFAIKKTSNQQRFPFFDLCMPYQKNYFFLKLLVFFLPYHFTFCFTLKIEALVLFNDILFT